VDFSKGRFSSQIYYLAAILRGPYSKNRYHHYQKETEIMPSAGNRRFPPKAIH
jgi:hypothetical protein